MKYKSKQHFEAVQYKIDNKDSILEFCPRAIFSNNDSPKIYISNKEYNNLTISHPGQFVVKAVGTDIYTTYDQSTFENIFEEV